MPFGSKTSIVGLCLVQEQRRTKNLIDNCIGWTQQGAHQHHTLPMTKPSVPTDGLTIMAMQEPGGYNIARINGTGLIVTK